MVQASTGWRKRPPTPVVIVDGDGNLVNSEETPVSSAVLATIASSAVSQTALAANASRRGVVAYNTDVNACLIKYGATASSSSFTVRLVQYAYWEMPLPIYTGIIDVIWEADGAGSLFVTES